MAHLITSNSFYSESTDLVNIYNRLPCYHNILHRPLNVLWPAGVLVVVLAVGRIGLPQMSIPLEIHVKTARV